ncbi:MAG: ABC transporter ATP-binding protein [Candidatus Krumholzibacteria bacterium]|nr:ABC transporter ATP-binding protein [Candidatus Krumholzibacteria bacterium]
MDNVLEARNLGKEYAGFALRDVSLTIPRGYILGLIGPNGSGKTTTIRMLMNMVKPSAGEIKIFGMDPAENEKAVKDRIGFVGDEQFYYENRSVAWTEEFVSRFFEKWDGELFNRLLGGFGIERRAAIRKLSKGMRVKLSIAIALSHDPELLILDEPTAGLDPVIRREILDRLMEFRGNEERSILISSHITDDIMRVADGVAFIVDGRVVLRDEKDSIAADWKRIHFRPGAAGGRLSAGLSCVKESAFGHSGITREYSKIREELAPGLASGDVRVENATLDDVLISFVKGE